MTLIEERLDYEFTNRKLLQRALTHKSFHNEHTAQSHGHNEVLEFLGDTVLDLVISNQLMELYPDKAEGHLSKMRAALVNESVLAEVAAELEIYRSLRLGKGEQSSGGAQKPRILASVFEAVIGAYFKDAGFEAVQAKIESLFTEKINKAGTDHADFADHKTILQEFAQEQKKLTPKYKVVDEIGPDHDKSFEVIVELAEQTIGRGMGKSKKQAEQDAARNAMEEKSWV